MTTSTFTPQAHSYVNGLQDSKIVLVDGQTLAQLMIEHNVGVGIRETFEIERIDEDFFSEIDV